MNKSFATISFSDAVDGGKPLLAVEVSEQKEVSSPGPVLPIFEYATTYTLIREGVCMVETSFYLNGVLVGTTTSYKYL